MGKFLRFVITLFFLKKGIYYPTSRRIFLIKQFIFAVPVMLIIQNPVVFVQILNSKLIIPLTAFYCFSFWNAVYLFFMFCYMDTMKISDGRSRWYINWLDYLDPLQLVRKYDASSNMIQCSASQFWRKLELKFKVQSINYSTQNNTSSVSTLIMMWAWEIKPVKKAVQSYWGCLFHSSYSVQPCLTLLLTK